MAGFLLLAAIIGAAVWIVYLQETQPPNPEIVCRHCGHKGQVRTIIMTRKRGISGGKATGAFFTGGASMLLTGLSRRQNVTNMHCLNCHVRWDEE